MPYGDLDEMKTRWCGSRRVVIELDLSLHVPRMGFDDRESRPVEQQEERANFIRPFEQPDDRAFLLQLLQCEEMAAVRWCGIWMVIRGSVEHLRQAALGCMLPRAVDY